MHWVQGVVFGAVFAVLIATCVELVSTFGWLEIPGLPWNLVYLLIPGGVIGGLMGRRRAPRPEQSLHRLDKANGFSDTLLSGYEFVVSRQGSENAEAMRTPLGKYLLAKLHDSLGKVRRDTLPPWGWRVMALGMVVAWAFFGVAASLATVQPANKTGKALGAWVPGTPLSVRGKAALTSVDDQELVSELLEELRQALGRSAVDDSARDSLEALQELSKSILAHDLPPAEALASLERLKSLLASEESSKGSDAELNGESTIKRLVEQAKAELGQGPAKDSGSEQAPSKLMESLAEWAMELAEKDPEAFEAMAKRLAKTMDGRALSRLKEKHQDLAKKFEALARRIGNDPKKKRRLKRLQAQLDSLSKEIAKKKAEKRPAQLERLRKAVDDGGSKREKGNATDRPKREQAHKKKGPGEPHKGMKPPARAEKKNEVKAPDGSSAKAKKTASALKKMANDLSREKSLRRVRKRLEKASSRLRREISEQRAAERMRRFRKKDSQKSGPNRLSKTAGQGNRARPSGSRAAAGGQRQGEGIKPGTSHEKQARARTGERRRQTDFKDSVVSNEGKQGSYRRRKYKTASTLGKGGQAAVKAYIDSELNDEVLKSRIPTRYRATVRTYFKLLPEIFVEQSE